MNIYDAWFNPNGSDLSLSFKIAANNTYQYGFTTRKHGQSFAPGEVGGYVSPDDNLNDKYEIEIDGMDGGTILVGFALYHYPGNTGQIGIPLDISQDGTMIARINHVVPLANAGDIGHFVIRTASA